MVLAAALALEAQPRPVSGPLVTSDRWPRATDLISWTRDVMRIEGTIVVADAGMVAPDDQVRATKVLANEGMKQRLARTRIAHLDGIACLNDCSGAEIIVDHRLDRSGANVGWNVPRFQLPEHLMDENTV